MSPFEDEVQPAFDPRLMDAPPPQAISDTRIDAPRPNTPAAMPPITAAMLTPGASSGPRKPFLMPPPGTPPQPKLDAELPPAPEVQAPQMAPQMPPQARGAMPPPPLTAELPPLEVKQPGAVGVPTGADARDVMGDRPPSPADLQMKSTKDALTEKLAARPAAPKENWGTRLATAILAMTKFAPATDLIVHPKWSSQERQYGRELEVAGEQFKVAKEALNSETLAEQREANSAMKNAQAAQAGVADATKRELNDPHRGMQEIDGEYVQREMPWLKPDGEGKFWVDKTIANTLAKPEKADPKPMIVGPGSTVVDESGKVLYSAPVVEKPKDTLTGEQAFFLKNWAATRGKTPEQLTPEENIKVLGEYKAATADPEIRAAVLESRAAADALRKMQESQQPTPEQARQVAADLVAHRIAPEQTSSLFGGFGTAGQNFKRMVYAEAKKLDPEFDFERASAEYGLVKSPVFQNTIRYMDSAAESIPLVIQRANELGNSNIRFVNGLVNATGGQFNDPKLKRFRTDALLVADEIAKILSGGGTGNGTSDAKLAQAQSLIQDSDSPQSVAAALADVQELFSYRRRALARGTYMENTGPKPAAPAAPKADPAGIR
jgi:hypothetical protein